MTFRNDLHGERQKKSIKWEGFQKGGLHKKGIKIFKKKVFSKLIRYYYTEFICNSNLHKASDLLHIMKFINYHKFSKITKAYLPHA